MGVSPRRLSGWEPAVATTYEYDDAGRLIGSVVEREPEWSREDVEAMVALMESKRIGPHGHPMDEAVSRDGDPSNPDRKWDYVVPLPTVDFAQRALDVTKQKYQKQYPDADLGSLLWKVEKRDR